MRRFSPKPGRFRPRARPKAGARKRGLLDRISARLNAYAHSHLHALFSSLGRLWRTPWPTLMTITVIAITLTLPAGFHVLVKNLQQISDSLKATNQISLFLQPTVEDKAGDRLAERLRSHPAIENLTVIHKAAALKEFQEYSGFGEALAALHMNPLPVVIEIEPKASFAQPGDLKALLAELRRLPEVDFAQLDMQWVKRLHSILNIIQRSIWLLSLLLAMAVLLIVGNTIRLEMQNRRDEIIIAKLIGATNAFIRRPFLYSGFWYSFLGSLLAWLFVCLMLRLLEEPVQSLSLLYDSPYQLRYLNWTDTGLFMALSSLLGIVGAWLVLGRHLHSLNPD